jgi:predicted TIM-barrel fold metal-dependent hydrolase
VSELPPPRWSGHDRALRWLDPPTKRQRRGRVRYAGPLARNGQALVLHLGFDGWSSPLQDVAMERADDGTWVAEVGTEDRVVVDCVVLEGRTSQCDNNDGADYRLWVDLDPIDSHVHVRTVGTGALGLDSLRAATSSAGMTHAIASWADNRFIDLVAAAVPWVTPLVWVSPHGPAVEEVQARLADGAVGLKLHPVHDAYPADTTALDPYLAVAADAGVPVTVHSSPGPADPDLIRRLAERFPTVAFVLYHTFLGPPEGRRRASAHARKLANLHLETSWCSSTEVERLLDEVGPDRVLFGSDAATDGSAHFVRHPPNIEGSENYNGGLLRLAQRLPPDVLGKLLEGNTRTLFGIPPPLYGSSPAPVGDGPPQPPAPRSRGAAPPRARTDRDPPTPGRSPRSP